MNETRDDEGREIRVILIGNYAYDGQQSMRRFADLFSIELAALKIRVETWHPPAFFGAMHPSPSGLGKWLGYIDKFVLFPVIIRLRLRGNARKQVVIHICDHSSAHYVKYVSHVPHLITCHDLLAIRSAHGEVASNPTGWTGRYFQKLILNGLNRTRRVICVSNATRDELLRLSSIDPMRVSVIRNGLNYPYSPLPMTAARTRVAELFKHSGDLRYIFHVGGNQWYKNRLGLLRIYNQLRNSMPNAPMLVMAGKAFTHEMLDFVSRNDLGSYVFSIEGCSNEDLRALYSAAELFVFPSLAEGFGWPIVEAQVCGCRVITTGRKPMTEVGGSAAASIDPEDIVEAAAHVQAMLDEPAAARLTRIQSGLANASTFATDAMIDSYVALYREELKSVPSTSGNSLPATWATGAAGANSGAEPAGHHET